MTKPAKKIELNGGTETKEPPVETKPALKKIALVGTASSSCDLAPYDDESWEIWTIGCNLQKNNRVTKMFELHTQSVLEQAQSWEGQYQLLKASAATWEARKKFAGSSWTSKQPEPLATPSRG